MASPFVNLGILPLCLILLLLPSSDATFFKYKEEKKQELLNHFRGHRGLGEPKYTGGGDYYGFTSLDQLFSNQHPWFMKQAIPVAYSVQKYVPVAHPLPVPLERPYPIPVPLHYGQALGEYSPSGYETALANYESIIQPRQKQHQQLFNYIYSHPRHQYTVNPIYEQDCHPYCDVKLPWGSSPVPLITKEKRILKMSGRQKQKQEDDLEYSEKLY